MPVLHGFAPAMEMRSHLAVNLSEISPVIHHLYSLLHKEINSLCSQPFQEAVCIPADLHEVSLGFSFLLRCGGGGMAAGSISSFMPHG